MSITKEAIDGPLQGAVHLATTAAGWLAVHDPSLSTLDVSNALIADILASHQDKALVDAWQRLGALRTIRAFARQRATRLERATKGSPALIRMCEGEVWWNDLRLGRIATLFQHIMPQEAQARLSYDTFRYRFLSWLERHCGALALDAEIPDAMTNLFIADGVPSPDIAIEWQRFVSHAFSATELQRTFVLLLNSITLAGKGFSVPDIPIVTRDQADVLIALFYKTLQNIALRLKRYEREVQEKTTNADIKGQSTKEQLATANKVKKLKEQLETQHNNYDQALAWMNETFEQLRYKEPERVLRIQMLAQTYTPIATGQLSARKDIMEKAATRIQELLMLTSDAFFTIPPLLSYEAPTFTMRNGGDSAKGVCYAWAYDINSP